MNIIEEDKIGGSIPWNPFLFVSKKNPPAGG
jgi:hypothetical protein